MNYPLGLPVPPLYPWIPDPHAPIYPYGTVCMTDYQQVNNPTQVNESLPGKRKCMEPDGDLLQQEELPPAKKNRKEPCDHLSNNLSSGEIYKLDSTNVK